MSEGQGRMGMSEGQGHSCTCEEPRRWLRGEWVGGPALGQGDQLSEAEAPGPGPGAAGESERGTSRPALSGTEGLPRLWGCRC